MKIHTRVYLSIFYSVSQSSLYFLDTPFLSYTWMDPKTLWAPGSQYWWIWFGTQSAMIAFKVTLGTWDYFQTWFLALTDFLKYQSLRMIDHLLHPITDYNFSDFEQNNLHLLSQLCTWSQLPLWTKQWWQIRSWIFQEIHYCSKSCLNLIPYAQGHFEGNHGTLCAKSNPPIWATWSSKGFRIHQHIAEIRGVWKMPPTVGHTVDLLLWPTKKYS